MESRKHSMRSHLGLVTLLCLVVSLINCAPTGEQQARLSEPSKTFEDCTSFDPEQAQVKEIDGNWLIVVGNLGLLEFHSNEQEARDALSVIQFYGFNKQCFVGRPDPSMEYYLVNDQAPSGMIQGEDCSRFDPTRIEVKIIRGRWKIVEGDLWIMDFEDNESETRTAFDLVQKYGFNQMCYVGRPAPSLIYFK